MTTLKDFIETLKEDYENARKLFWRSPANSHGELMNYAKARYLAQLLDSILPDSTLEQDFYKEFLEKNQK